jgi:polyketide synthase PksN
VSYVETAATGAPVADTIEVRALAKVFGDAARTRCPIGSVKANMGHAEPASGMMQLAKVVLQMRHRQLVPTRAPKSVNPDLRLEETPFYLQCALQDWQRPRYERAGEQGEVPRRALINSFGAGGTCASVLIEEYEPAVAAADTGPGATLPEEPEIVLLSAKDLGRLHVMTRRLLEYLRKHEEIKLAEVAYTTQLGREAMQCRVAWIVRDRAELLSALEAYVETRASGAEGANGVTVYFGDGGDHPGVTPASTASGDDVATSRAFAEGNLWKVAELWAQGHDIDWSARWRGRPARMRSLPTYPFRHGGLSPRKATQGDRTAPIANYILKFLASELGVEATSLNVRKDLREYGVDSLLGRRLLRALEERFAVRMSGRGLVENGTVTGLAKLVADAGAEESDAGASPGSPEAAPYIRVDVEESPSALGPTAGLLEKFRAGSIEYGEMEALIAQGSIL